MTRYVIRISPRGKVFDLHAVIIEVEGHQAMDWIWAMGFSSIDNVMKHALKHAPEGPRTITVELKEAKK